jgi:hypothetical protein
MNQKKSISEIQKQIDVLNEEEKKDNIFLENYKKEISKEILKFDRKEIKNNYHIEKKYSVWQRILIALGVNL